MPPIDDAVVTRQCGLSSVARHRGIVTCFRNFVAQANRLRFCALLLVAYYYTVCAANGHPPVPVLTDAVVDSFFRLLYNDVLTADDHMRAAALQFRTVVLGAQNFPLPALTGAMYRVSQSFRVNIKTAIGNMANDTGTLMKNYLIATYGFKYREAKLLAARLGSSQEEILCSARKEYRRVLQKSLDEVTQQMEREGDTAARRERRRVLIQKLRTVDDSDFDDAELLAAFDRKYPYPDEDADDDFAEGLRDVWQTEFGRLPTARDDFFALSENRNRMVLACDAAHRAGVKCSTFAHGPVAGFACDFVPVDKKCLELFLNEAQTGSHGASAALCAWLRNNPRTDGWGLFQAFEARKLRGIHTAKHVIDGQFLTDGVRVVFPLRSHEGAARKAERSAKSAMARSTEGKANLVHAHMATEDAYMYESACAYFDEEKSDKDEKAVCKGFRDALYHRAQAVANLAKKKEAAEARKRELESKTQDEREAERFAKRQRREAGKFAHITLEDGITHVTGVDVGHCNPVFAARMRVGITEEEERPETYHVSLGQWYTDTGQKHRTKRLNIKVNKARRAGRLPQLASVKTSDMGELRAAMRQRLQHYDANWSVYGSVTMRKLAFDVYVKKQKTLRTIAKCLLPDEHTVLAWGDGDFAHTRRGLPTAVGGTIERFIKTHYPGRLRITPEFRTSCLCAACHHYNKNLVHGFVKRRNGQFARTGGTPAGRLIPRKIHGVLQCKHCHARWNRDVNGAVNIGMLYLSIARTGEVPLRFKRGYVIPEADDAE